MNAVASTHIPAVLRIGIVLPPGFVLIWIEEAYRIRRAGCESGAVSLDEPVGVPYGKVAHSNDPEAAVMSHKHSFIAALALTTLAFGTAASMADAPEATTWQHHHATFAYYGITTLYSCDGLEGKVGQILLFLGARDPRVQADGCPRGGNSPSHIATVSVDFDTLVAAASAPASDVVQAQWTPFKLEAQRPYFMGQGDCELMRAMQPMLTKSFSLRSLNYSVGCTPHQLSIADFRVQGEVLKTSKLR
jgi:hypothetical protein